MNEGEATWRLTDRGESGAKNIGKIASLHAAAERKRRIRFIRQFGFYIREGEKEGRKEQRNQTL